MKLAIVFLILLFISACGGNKSEVDQYELYGDKRVDCETTKNTDQAANITQCPKIRADDVDVSDTDDLIESYSPDSYNNIY